jgi:hypothetical protein
MFVFKQLFMFFKACCSIEKSSSGTKVQINILYHEPVGSPLHVCDGRDRAPGVIILVTRKHHHLGALEKSTCNSINTMHIYIIVNNLPSETMLCPQTVYSNQ